MKKFVASFIVSISLFSILASAQCFDAASGTLSGSVESATTGLGISTAKVSIEGCLSWRSCQAGWETRDTSSFYVPVLQARYEFNDAICVSGSNPIIITASAAGYQDYVDVIMFLDTTTVDIVMQPQ